MHVYLQVGLKLRGLLRMQGRLLLGGCGAGDEGLLVDAVLRRRLAAADALRDELAVHLDAKQAACSGAAQGGCNLSLLRSLLQKVVVQTCFGVTK